MASNADHPLAGYAASVMPMSARLDRILMQAVVAGTGRTSVANP